MNRIPQAFFVFLYRVITNVSLMHSALVYLCNSRNSSALTTFSYASFIELTTCIALIISFLL